MSMSEQWVRKCFGGTVFGIATILIVSVILTVSGCQPAASVVPVAAVKPATTAAAQPASSSSVPAADSALNAAAKSALELPASVGGDQAATETQLPPAGISTEVAEGASTIVDSPAPAESVPAAAESPAGNAAATDKPSADVPPGAEPAEPPASTDTRPQPAADGQQADVLDAQRGAVLPPANPFERRINAPDFPKGMQWMNSRPLAKEDLKGKFVLLDFWTYCCINCMHILPELKKLEKEFDKQLVVIGVHSAKFDTEKDADNIRAAILRYEIDHPVVNDADHKLWDEFGVSSWPTILMIDPEGNAVWGRGGEFKAEEVRAILNVAIPHYRARKLLDETPFALEPEVAGEEATPLRFPGKVLADEAGERLFISDSNHNRIVITTLDGELLDVIGSGEIGRTDGDFKTASFNHPQGCALDGETLYVADTENHLLRAVDLGSKSVSTIAGTGDQAASAWPGLEHIGPGGPLPDRWVGQPATTLLNSPWALWVHKGALYIAMAGPHQIWKMPLSQKEIGPFAGNGREDIVDGPLLPKRPYMLGFSSFAQPSGLSSDGTWLYVADSEGSSIRAVPFDPRAHVKTVVGSDNKDFGRLFDFGDVDGPRKDVKLQHCLDVVYVKGKVYVADTYNHKIKVVDAKNGETKTIAGTGRRGSGDEPAEFHEPAGLAHAKGKLYIADTNNHQIRTLDLATRKVATLTIVGLTSPADLQGNAVSAPKKPSFKGAIQEKLKVQAVKAVDGKVKLAVWLEIPDGWKINPLAPMSYWVDATSPSGPVDRSALGRTKLSKPAADFEVALPVSGPGEDEVKVSLNYYYCEEKDDGVCKVGAVVFTVPLKIARSGQAEPVRLVHAIPQ